MMLTCSKLAFGRRCVQYISRWKRRLNPGLQLVSAGSFLVSLLTTRGKHPSCMSIRILEPKGSEMSSGPKSANDHDVTNRAIIHVNSIVCLGDIMIL